MSATGGSQASVRSGRQQTIPPPLTVIPEVAAHVHTRGTHRCHNGSDANATAADIPQESTAPSSSTPAIQLTVVERCHRAQSIASRWMSSLMTHPPTDAQMSLFRSHHSTTSAAEQAALTGVAPLTPAGATAASKPAVASSSFAEAVRKGSLACGGGDAKTATPPLVPTPAPLPVTASIPATTARSATVHADPAGAALPTPSAAEEPSLFPLMPVDADAVAPLLRSLREVALSSSSLDTMRKLSALPGSDLSGVFTGATGSGSGGGGGNKRHHTHQGSAHVTPRQSPSLQPSDVPVPATAAVVDPLVESVFLEQWRTVQLHLLKAEKLVQNAEELSRSLSSALGPDWRTAPPAVSAEGGTSSTAPAATGTTAATASTTTTTGPTPSATTAAAVGAPPAPVVSPPVALGGATGSGLNLNARPFQSRAFITAIGTPLTPPGSPIGLSGRGIATVDSVNTPVSSARKGSTATMQKLSESTTAYYSPSPHVASFIERNSPVPPVGSGASSVTAPSFASLRSTPVDDDDGNGVDGDARHTSAAVVRTPSSASSTTSHRALDGMPVPVTPAAIGDTVASAHFPSHPRSARFAGTGGDNNSVFTVSSTNGTVGPRHSPHGYYSMQSSTRMGGAGSMASPGSVASQGHHSNNSLAFHLESREDMLRRRQAAPNTFYSSSSHPNSATSPASYSGGGATGVYSPTSLRPHHVGNTPMSVPVSPLISLGNTPVMAPQCPYDYVLVLDFEATCEEYPPPGYLYEIIEFPVVLVDVHLQRAVTEFHRFVKPKYKPVLTTFCKSLTGIRQHEIDSAQPLEEVLRQFERWLHQTIPPTARVVFATDGPMDFREFMLHHSVQRQGIRFPTLFYQFIDVKQAFATFLHCQPGKIKAMLEVLNIPFEGRLHSGLDDARNIARIVIGLLQWGSTLCEAPLNRLPLNSGGGGAQSASTASTSSATGFLYLPPSSVEPVDGTQRSRASLGFPNGGNWSPTTNDTSCASDGAFYA